MNQYIQEIKYIHKFINENKELDEANDEQSEFETEKVCGPLRVLTLQQEVQEVNMYKIV